MVMKIGIIGAGHIGSTTAELFARAGHAVTISNDSGPDSLKEVVAKIDGDVRAGTVAEAAAFGEVVLFAIPFGAYKTLSSLPLAGKIIVDATNAFGGRNGSGNGQTSTEAVAKEFPDAKVVKAFNTMNFKTLATAGKPGAARDERLVLFVAGDDKKAKATVSKLIEEIGFAAVDTGALHEGSVRQQAGAAVWNKKLTPAAAAKML
jgi:8-hydroxy-5-deazaflavin:NADPH oxidoreductase